jgi:hypothetical protein
MSSSWETVVAPTATISQYDEEDGYMVRCASLFSELVALFNKSQFYHLVKNHRVERYSKGYSSWDHFVTMLFCQLAQAKSLREICGGLACTTGKLRHLGMKEPPNKSTLSYSNTHRDMGHHQVAAELSDSTCNPLQKYRFSCRAHNEVDQTWGIEK